MPVLRDVSLLSQDAPVSTPASFVTWRHPLHIESAGTLGGGGLQQGLVARCGLFTQPAAQVALSWALPNEVMVNRMPCSLCRSMQPKCLIHRESL